MIKYCLRNPKSRTYTQGALQRARMTNEVIFYKDCHDRDVPTTHREAEPGARSRPHAHTRGRVRTRTYTICHMGSMMESDASEYTFI